MLNKKLVVTLFSTLAIGTVALSVNGLIGKLSAEMQSIRDANVIVYNLPPIIGLGTGSGFEFQLLSLSGGNASEIAQAARGLVFAAKLGAALELCHATYQPAISAALARSQGAGRRFA